MSAAAPIPPPEEVALLELELERAPPAEAPPEDPDSTLPWERSAGKGRASPDGGRAAPEEAEAGAEAPPAALPHVFVPIDPHCIERSPGGKRREEGPEAAAPRRARGGGPKQLLLPAAPSRCREPSRSEGRAAKAERCPGARGCGRDNLKAVASVVGALLLGPCVLYGAYVFLPFDAPLLPTLSARLVYALRCAAFATVPIVLGMIVSAISRLCSSALEPFGELQREVEVHRAFVLQSCLLFLLYFLNVAVLASHLPQELLKLIPLLTGLFAISRLMYWLAYAMGRSFRVFGFSLSFLPLLGMLLWNLATLLLLEPENLLAVAKPEEHSQRSGAKLRYWG